MTLQQEIDDIFGQDLVGTNHARAVQIFNEFIFFLNRGEVRAAERVQGDWRVNEWVKKGILLGFQLGEMEEVVVTSSMKFFEKHTYRLKKLSLSDGIRLVPGGSSIRDGAYVARGVICMPPMYINVGAYIDEDTVIDSHALVGSCAQVGKRVHVSAGAHLGSVLEPISAMPVIIEDDVFLGGHSGVYEGIIVKKGAVIAPGVTLMGGTTVYDTVRQEVYRKMGDRPLIIPDGAVVVSGNRPLSGEWADAEHLSVSTPIILNYRDVRVAASVALEDGLR